MTTYLGNPSLSTAVKDRVGATFQQALALYKQGRIDEVKAGCDLILKMDPLFDPARRLLEKARDPNSPVDVDSLVPPSDTGDALAMARQAMGSRDYQKVVNITTEILTNDLMNEDARVLGDQAREKMEAAPFVDQFLKKYQEHMATGNMQAAKAVMEKARSLDPGHPAIAAMETLGASGASGAPLSAPSQDQVFDFGAPSSPSFVVDNPVKPAGRGSADPSDFGFTFEEDKPQPPAMPAGGFSFDSPAPAPAAAPPPSSNADESSFAGLFSSPAEPAPAPAAPATDSSFGGFSFDTPSSSGGGLGGFSFEPAAPAAPGGGFDFTTAPTQTSSDDQKKIDQYLSDGDRSFDGGDYQQAIDAWSRIFLIDVTNEQASERIEKAKGKRREIDQRVESMVSNAVRTWERKDFDSARSQFTEVLKLDPTNSTATDYLARNASEPAPAAPHAPSRGSEPAATEPAFADDDWGPPAAEAPAAAPTSTGKTKAAQRPAEAAAKPSAPQKSSMTLIATIAGLAVVVALGLFGYFHFMRKPAYDPTATTASLKQASSLAQKGQYDAAIGLLQDIKPEDPQHDKALEMIADLQHRKSQSSQLVVGRPAARVFQEQLAAGKAAFDAHDYMGAKKALEEAARIRQLPPDMKAMYDDASSQVGKLDNALSLFKEGKYQDAINYLQQLNAKDAQNQNIQQLLSNAHFNLGAIALQEGKLTDAEKQFDEVLKGNPGDDLAKRSKELAVRYQGQSQDLLYRIYVKYLPPR